MEARFRGPGRDLGLPRRPRLGPGTVAEPGRPGPRLHRGRRLRRRRHRLRPALLRDIPARSAGHGPAAAAAAGNLVGAAGARRHRSGTAARQQDRRVRRHDGPGVRPPAARGPGDARRSDAHRQDDQRRLGPHRIRARTDRARAHRRHRLLVLTGGAPPGRGVPAARRVLAGPRRRRHRAVDAGHLHRNDQPAGAGARRPLQGLRRRRRWDRLLGRCRDAAGRAALRRTPQRPPGARGRTRLRDQPGRRVQRPHRAQRALPAAGRQGRLGQRRARLGRRGHAGGPRHRNRTGRPHRGGSAAGDVRPGQARRPAAAARLAQVQHRPHTGRSGCSRRHQGGTGYPARPRAGHAPRRRTDARGGLVHRNGAPGHGEHPLARDQPGPAGRGLLVRYQRDQRPRDRRAGTRRRCGLRGDTRAPGAAARGWPAALDRFGPHSGRTACSGRTAAAVRRRQRGDGRGVGARPGHHQDRAGTPRRGGGGGPRDVAGRTRRTGDGHIRCPCV